MLFSSDKLLVAAVANPAEVQNVAAVPLPVSLLHVHEQRCSVSGAEGGRAVVTGGVKEGGGKEVGGGAVQGAVSSMLLLLVPPKLIDSEEQIKTGVAGAQNAAEHLLSMLLLKVSLWRDAL